MRNIIDKKKKNHKTLIGQRTDNGSINSDAASQPLREPQFLFNFC